VDSQVHPSLITFLPASDHTEHGGLDVRIEFKCPNCGDWPHTMIEYVSRVGIDFNTCRLGTPMRLGQGQVTLGVGMRKEPVKLKSSSRKDDVRSTVMWLLTKSDFNNWRSA